ncbi:hypothetical protein VNI00_010168 [Paramarasmius palmivorus]|uniref:Uncharacterized protein n=1 Tax=Paramarasmius palmivorus TaxID=297713 RepID=A0AAW0CHE7_9AGAR
MATAGFQFPPALHQSWPVNPAYDDADHAESITEQLYERQRQKRELPFYSIFPGTVMPYLCATYSQSPGTLRLEGAPTPEVYYRDSITRVEMEQVVDPDWQEESDSQEIDDDMVLPSLTNHRDEDMTAQAHSLPRSLLSGLDGASWATNTTRESRAAQKRVVTRNLLLTSNRQRTGSSETPTQGPPDSQRSDTTTTTLPDNVSICIVRASDALFLAREKLSHLRQRKPGATHPPSIPALSAEIKVPSAYDPALSDEIAKADAAEEILEAMPQIVQHAQFILHQYPNLKAIWTAGVSGKWIQFFKFTREETPRVRPVRITKSNPYYSDPELPAEDVPEIITDVIAFVDEDGNYTEDFKSLWRDVIATVEAGYAAVAL